MNTVEFVDGGAPGITAALLNEPFQIKEFSKDENNNITVTIGSGRANFGSVPVVEMLTDTDYNITPTVVDTTYYILLKNDGSFTHIASPAASPVNPTVAIGQVLIGAIVVGANVDTVSKKDLRGMLPGCYQTVPSLLMKNGMGLTPYLDFYSSGNSNYDARISCSGGSTTAGKGDIICNAKYLQIDDEILNKWAILSDTSLYTENPEHLLHYQDGYHKNFRVKYPGDYRVFVQLKTSNATYPAVCSISTTRYVGGTASSPYATYTEYHFELIGLGANEIIHVSCGVGGDKYHTGTTGGVRNIRVCCDYSNKAPYTYGPITD